MDREKIIQKAKEDGWRVIDLNRSGMARDIPWAHWEVIEPGRGPVFRANTEDEAWDHVYVRLTNNPT